jgi:hypothetical protein
MSQRMGRVLASAACALLLILPGCGGGSSPTGPTGPPTGTAAELAALIATSFIAGTLPPTNVDTTASFLATVNVNGLRASTVLFISPTTGLQDAGTVSVWTGATANTQTDLDKRQLVVSGILQTLYTTVTNHPLGINLPFDGTSFHRFTVSGSGSVPAFADSVLSVTLPAISAPSPGANVSRASDLTVSWSNAGSDTTIYCLAAVRSQSDSSTIAISTLVRDADGSTVIPAARLGAIPAGSAWLVLARFRLVHHAISGGRKLDLVCEAVETRAITLN